MLEIIPNWHPIFVHFTVALFSVASGLYAVSVFVPNEKLKAQWRIVARWNLWFGMLLTLITVLTGWYAYNTVTHDEPSHLAMTDHRNWALLTVTLYLLVTVWSIARHRAGKEASPLLLLFMLVALTSLGSTAWRGGEVVYRYGLGVMSLPNTSQHAHGSNNESHGHLQRVEESGHGHTEVEIEEHHATLAAEESAEMPHADSRVDAPVLVKQSDTETEHHDSTPHSH